MSPQPGGVPDGGAPHPGERPEPDEPPVIANRAGDDTDAGWGERWHDGQDGDDERYLRERPPHWE